MEFIDVAIIGGGPAGLTAANTLARQRHTAVVFDSGSYRNSGAAHMHMVLTWDHKSPNEYRNAARKNILENYSTIQFADVAVTEIAKESDFHFKVRDGNGKVWEVQKVILAVGSTNAYPDIDGYEELWMKRIYHCLFCHGYEDRDAPSSGVLAVPPVGPAVAVHMAHNAAQLTDRVTIYTNGDAEVEAELRPLVSPLPASRFGLETRPIRRLVPGGEDGAGSGSVTVEFADGSAAREESFLAHNPRTAPQGPFVAQLGLATTPLGDIRADTPFWQTSAPGVSAVGDCSTPYKVVASAVTSGCNAAVMASAEIQAAKYSQPPGL